MSRLLPSRPASSLRLTKKQKVSNHQRQLLSSVSILFLAILSIILLCPLAVSASDEKSEYGTVIGIGTYIYPFKVYLRWIGTDLQSYRSRNNVSGN